MRVAIVAAGARMKDATKLRSLLKSVDRILCADGGWDTLEDLGIRPDVLLGDFDSVRSDLSKEALVELCTEQGIFFQDFPSRKAKTDAELALDYALAMGADEALLLQATGNRWDHTLCNMFLIPVFSARGLRVSLIGDKNELFYLPEGRHVLSAEECAFLSTNSISEETFKTGAPHKSKESIYSGYVSFLADPEDVHLTLIGFDYELADALLRRGSSLCVSNHLNAEKGLVEIRGKGVFCIISNGD